MIKVTANRNNVDVHEVSGNGVQIMAELCTIVAAVCQVWCEDENDSEKMKNSMMKTVARMLLDAKGKVHGKKIN